MLLALIWTVCGVYVTQSLLETEAEAGTIEPNSIWDGVVLPIMGNALVATPLWLILEEALRLGPPGLQVYGVENYVASGLGLLGTVFVAKVSTRDWR